MKKGILGSAFLLGVLGVVGAGCGSTGNKSLFTETPDGGGGGGGKDSGGTGEPDPEIDPTDPDASTPDDGGLKGCATAEADAKTTPVYMDIVLDGSGSMNNAPREADPLAPPQTTGKKWLAVRGALNSFFNDLGAASPTDNTFGVGMFVFSSSGGKPTSEIRAVNLAQAASLNAQILPPSFPSLGTPLCTSMATQIAVLSTFVPAPPLEPGGKRVLLVITDGVPDGGTLNSQAACKTNAVNALAGNPSITTFVVGVGEPTASPTDYDEVFMGELARAGGAPAAGCNPNWNLNTLGVGDTTGVPCHFQITPSASNSSGAVATLLKNAINAIRDQVRSCEFALEKKPGQDIDPAKVNVVRVDAAGVEHIVPKNGSTGWSYDNDTDPTKVILNGAACTEFKNETGAKVKIVLGCKSHIN
jgi:hypothetical protein